MIARALLAALLVASGCTAAEEVRPASAGRPNIVMIVSDDHGYPDFGFMGSQEVQTPNLDALAAAGSVFPVTYNTASVCRPSLNTLLTGLDPLQWASTTAELARRHPGRKPNRQVRAFPTLPRILGRHGYATFQSGKFWEGTYEMAGFSHGLKTKFAMGLDDTDAWAGGEASLAVGRTTMQPVFDFIDAHRDRAFYVWFAPMLPHVPFDAPAEFTERYADSGLSPRAQAYYANVTRLDAAVGELVAHVERRGLSERTLFVFLSDNGWEVDQERDGEIFVDGAKGKSSMYELGWRTPLVFQWPGVVPAGEVKPTLASTLDLFPTLLDFAGIDQDPRWPGISLKPVLEGGDPTIRNALYGSDRGIRPRETAAAGRPPQPRAPAFFVRTERWHYIWNSEDDSQALYDVAEDPAETRDRAGAHPELTAELRLRIGRWRDGVRKPLVPALP